VPILTTCRSRTSGKKDSRTRPRSSSLARGQGALYLVGTAAGLCPSYLTGEGLRCRDGGSHMRTHRRHMRSPSARLSPMSWAIASTATTWRATRRPGSSMLWARAKSTWRLSGDLLPMFGALYYWFPKFTGRLLDERLGHLNVWRRRSSSCPLSIALSCSPEACPCIGRTRL
jgi:hypothetical protein